MSKKEGFDIDNIDSKNNEGFIQNEDMLETIISECNENTLIDRFNTYWISVIGFDDLSEDDYIEEHKIDNIYVYKIFQDNTLIDCFFSDIPLFEKKQYRRTVYNMIEHPFVEYSKGGVHKCMCDLETSYIDGKFIGFCEQQKIRSIVVLSDGTFSEDKHAWYKALSDYEIAIKWASDTDYSTQIEAFNSGNIFEFIKNPTPRKVSLGSYPLGAYENIIEGIYDTYINIRNTNTKGEKITDIGDIESKKNEGFRQNEEMLKSIISHCNKNNLIERFPIGIEADMLGFDNLSYYDSIEVYKIDEIYVYKIMQNKVPIDYLFSIEPLFTYHILEKKPLIEYSIGGEYNSLKDIKDGYVSKKFIAFCEEGKRRTLTATSDGKMHEGNSSNYKPIMDYHYQSKLVKNGHFKTELSPKYLDRDMKEMESQQTYAIKTGDIFNFLKYACFPHFYFQYQETGIGRNFKKIIESVEKVCTKIKSESKNDKKHHLKVLLSRNKDLDEQIDVFAPKKVV